MNNKLFILLLSVLTLLISCNESEVTKTNELVSEHIINSIDTLSSEIKQPDSLISDYSEEFLEFERKGHYELSKDTLFVGKRVDYLLLPTDLDKFKSYHFYSSNTELTIRRLNYTTIEYNIVNNGKIYNGKASLIPEWYLGGESISCPNGECWVNIYYSQNDDSFSISIGNEDLTEGEVELFVGLRMNIGNKRIEELLKLKK